MVALSVPAAAFFVGWGWDISKAGRTLKEAPGYHCLLHLLGWSVGDVAFRDGDTGKKSWLVIGTRGEHVISVQGRSQSDAWREACGLAGRVEPEGPLLLASNDNSQRWQPSCRSGGIRRF